MPPFFHLSRPHRVPGGIHPPLYDLSFRHPSRRNNCCAVPCRDDPYQLSPPHASFCNPTKNKLDTRRLTSVSVIALTM